LFLSEIWCMCPLSLLLHLMLLLNHLHQHTQTHTHTHTHSSDLSVLCPVVYLFICHLFCLSLHRNTLLNCCMLYRIETHTPHDPHLMKLPVKTKHYCYPDNSCVLQNASQSQMFRTKAVTLFTH